MNRRHFLSTAAIAPMLASASESQSRSANDRIQIAVIGFGNRGGSDAAVACRVPGVTVVSVADLYSGRREHAREVFGNGI
jgi:threonine dehydrogenase-like Zn-dependent dehydrogenase